METPKSRWIVQIMGPNKLLVLLLVRVLRLHSRCVSSPTIGMLLRTLGFGQKLQQKSPNL
jgi:hypothetical protein